jgi:hypothetical protein
LCFFMMKEKKRTNSFLQAENLEQFLQFLYRHNGKQIKHKMRSYIIGNG